VVGASITALRPVMSGNVTGFTISPALPPGLSIDPAFGTIFGTPTAPVPTTTYTVDANSEEGRVTTTVSLTVLDQIPRLSYNPASWDLMQNVPLAGSIAPTVSGGVVVSWAIDRALPAGLTFDSSNGQITGTPTEASPRTSYVVSATNSGGTSSATVSILVQAATSTNLVRLAGKTAVEQNGDWLEVLDRSTAAPLSQIDMPAGTRWWQLASDGSYLVTATDSQLTVWSTAGAELFTKRADYSAAQVFAAAHELRIGAGAAGANIIEIISVPAGTGSIGACYPGTFQSWSEDGATFFVKVGDIESEVLLQPALPQARVQPQN